MISFQLDDFIRDKDETYWTAILSDDRLVFQDDDRPGEMEPRALIRLKEFCETNNLYIKQVKIRFRSHEVTCPENHEGYYIKRGAFGQFSDGKGRSSGLLVVGQIINNELQITRYIIPEVEISEIGGTETRTIEGNEDGIIWNKKSHSYLQIQEKCVVQPTT